MAVRPTVLPCVEYCLQKATAIHLMDVGPLVFERKMVGPEVVVYR